MKVGDILVCEDCGLELQVIKTCDEGRCEPAAECGCGCESESERESESECESECDCDCQEEVETTCVFICCGKELTKKKA
jgi:hypothetical protein